MAFSHLYVHGLFLFFSQTYFINLENSKQCLLNFRQYRPDKWLICTNLLYCLFREWSVLLLLWWKKCYFFMKCLCRLLGASVNHCPCCIMQMYDVLWSTHLKTIWGSNAAHGHLFVRLSLVFYSLRCTISFDCPIPKMTPGNLLTASNDATFI